VLEQIVRYLVNKERCPLCGHAYEQRHIQLVRPGKVEFPLWVLHIHCEGCDSDYQVKVWAKPPLDDFVPGERGRFEGVQPVGTSDLLDIAAFLRDYTGDMKQLFPAVAGSLKE